MKFKEKHVERLLRGKRSGANIGSRNTPHHLHQHERAAFERAIKQRFLTVSYRDRPNLENIWQKYCLAKGWTCYVLRKDAQGGGLIFRENECIEEMPLKEAKNHLQTLVQ